MVLRFYYCICIFIHSRCTIFIFLSFIFLVLFISIEEASCASFITYFTYFPTPATTCSLYKLVFMYSFIAIKNSTDLMIAHAFIVIAIQTFYLCYLFKPSVLFLLPLHLSFLFSLTSGVFSVCPLNY